MIKLISANKGKIPDADYVLDKTDHFLEILNVLTPKFTDKWLFVLLDPKISFVKDLLNNNSVPDWVDVLVFTSDKKIDTICLEFPKLQPRKVTKRETFDEVIAGLKHLVDATAQKTLYKAYLSNPTETVETLQKLDAEERSSITLRDVQKNFILDRKVYASEVIDAFLLKETNRWAKYQFILKEIGMEITYYAMYKYVKKLVVNKNSYLQNQDVKLYSVKKIDAPLIAYAFLLFTNSSSYKQLPAIMYALDNRSKESALIIKEVL